MNSRHTTCSCHTTCACHPVAPVASSSSSSNNFFSLYVSRPRFFFIIFVSVSNFSSLFSISSFSKDADCIVKLRSWLGRSCGYSRKNSFSDAVTTFDDTAGALNKGETLLLRKLQRVFFPYTIVIAESQANLGG